MYPRKTSFIVKYTNKEKTYESKGKTGSMYVACWGNNIGYLPVTVQAASTSTGTTKTTKTAKIAYAVASPSVVLDSHKAIYITTVKDYKVYNRSTKKWVVKRLNRKLKTVKVDGRVVKAIVINNRKLISSPTDSNTVSYYLYKVYAKTGIHSVEVTDTAGITREELVRVYDITAPRLADNRYTNYYKYRQDGLATYDPNYAGILHGVVPKSITKKYNFQVMLSGKRTIKSIKIVRKGKVIYNKKNPKLVKVYSQVMHYIAGTTIIKNTETYYRVSGAPTFKNGDKVTVTDSKGNTRSITFNQPKNSKAMNYK